MSACIVSTDVSSQKTCAFTVSLILSLFGNSEIAVERGLVGLHGHAAGTVCPVCRKAGSFRTRLYGHAVSGGSLNECFAYRKLVLI